MFPAALRGKPPRIVGQRFNATHENLPKSACCGLIRQSFSVTASAEGTSNRQHSARCAKSSPNFARAGGGLSRQLAGRSLASICSRSNSSGISAVANKRSPGGIGGIQVNEILEHGQGVLRGVNEA